MVFLEKFEPKSLAPLLTALGVVVPPSVPKFASLQQDNLLNPDNSGEKFAGCEDDREFHVSDFSCSEVSVFFYTWIMMCGDVLAAYLFMGAALCVHMFLLLVSETPRFLCPVWKILVCFCVYVSVGVSAHDDIGAPCLSCVPCAQFHGFLNETMCCPLSLVDHCSAPLDDGDDNIPVEFSCKETLAANLPLNCFWNIVHAILAFGRSCILCAVARFLFCTGLARRSKTGKEISKTCQTLVILRSPQVVFCCGGLVAAAAFVGGIVKCYQALPAAARGRAFVLPYVKNLEVVFSTAVSVMGQCEAMSYGLRLVRFAVTSGHVLGLRIDEVSKPHREDGQVVAGCLSVGNGVQATGRVDVPGGNILTAMWRTQSILEDTLDVFNFETEVLSTGRYLTEPVLSKVLPQPVREIQVLPGVLQVVFLFSGFLSESRALCWCPLCPHFLEFLPSCSILR